MLRLQTFRRRNPKIISYEIKAIEKLADAGTLEDWLKERGQRVGDGSREAMIRAARHWRGLGDDGDESFVDKGVVLPEARAWLQAAEVEREARALRDREEALMKFYSLEPVSFVRTECCAMTYATGVPLLRCTRCKRTFYASREAQKAHWPLHKRSCREVGEDEARSIDALSLDPCFAALKRSLQQGGDATTELLMARLRALFDAGADDEGTVEMDAHTLGRGLICHGGDAFFDALWAAPGMASHLLLDDWLLNEVERKEKYWFPLGLPSRDALDDLESTPKAAAETLIAHESETSGGWGAPQPAMKFAYLYFNIIVASLVQGSPSMSSVHDGSGRLRQNAVADVARRRAMALWACPYVRSCCGDALAPAPSLACTLVSRDATTLSPPRAALDPFDASAGGLPGVVDAALEEVSQGMASRHALRLLGDMVECGASLLRHCNVEDRARIAVALVAFAIDNNRSNDADIHGEEPGCYGRTPVKRGVLGSLFAALFDAPNTVYEDKQRGWLRAQILRAAVEEEAAVGPIGCNDTPRGFFQWLRIKDARGVMLATGLPEGVAAVIGDFAAPDTPIDLLARLEEFEQLEEEEDEDKRTALRRARGPHRDVKWCAMAERKS